MSLSVVWLEQAEDDLKALPDWRMAAAVDAAVNRFAAEGVGFLRHIHIEDVPDEWRLYLAGRGAAVYVVVRRTAATLYVETRRASSVISSRSRTLAVSER